MMSKHTPKVIGAPDVMWVNYGELDEDTHHEIIRDSAESGLTCCEVAKGGSDVKYVRADIVDNLLDALKDCAKALSQAEKKLNAPIESLTLDKSYTAIAKAEGVLND